MAIDFGLVSVLLECVIQASAMAGEHSRRKKQRASDTLTMAVQQLDAEAVAASVSSVRLATFMRGGITATDVEHALNSQAFRGMIKQMFLAIVTDHSHDLLDSTKLSMRIILESELSSKSSEDDCEFFCNNVISSLEEASVSILEQIRTKNPGSLVSLQQGALLKRLTAVLENVDKNLTAISETMTPGTVESRQRWISTYRTLCSRVHGFIQPPDFDNNQKFPMAELYVLPNVSVGGPQNYNDGSNLDFDSFRTTIDRTILLGDPGGGKSTFSNYIAMHWAGSDEGIIPFHVTLREYAQVSNEFNIVQYIEQQLSSKYQFPAPQGLVEALLMTGEAAVIFDGLDELIDTTKRRLVSQTVEIFGLLYPLARILVTSRRIGYNQSKLDAEIFSVRVISSFEERDVRNYVHKWFACQNDYGDGEVGKLTESFMTQSQSVPDLRSNPLMLSLMCIIFRGENFIPRNRPAVYEKCANLLFEKWDGHRDIVVPLEARAHVDAALKHVAFWMLDTQDVETGVDYDKLVQEMASYLRGRAFDTADDSIRAATEFVDFCKGRAWVFSDAGTTADGDPLFTFTHRTFMEYFAAFHLTRVHDTPEKLAKTLLPKVAKEEWDVVAQLAVQIEDKSVDRGSERVLTAMLDERRKRSLFGRTSVVAFIARCAYFSTISPAFLRKLSRTCVQFAFDGMDKPRSMEFHYSTRPWLELMSSGVEAHRETIAEVHSVEIKLAIAERGSSQWISACRMIFFGQSLAWPGSVYQHDQGWSTWMPLFRAIATEVADDLRHFFELDFSYRSDVMISGIMSPKEIVEHCLQSGMAFSDVFFDFGDLSYLHVKSTSLASLMMFIGHTDHRDGFEDSVAFSEELSEIFLNEFWKTIESGNHWTHSRGVYTGFYTGNSIDLSNSQSVIETTFLIGLSRSEVVPRVSNAERSFEGANGLFERLRDARSTATSFDILELEKYSLSERLKEFAGLWLQNKVSVFELTESNRSQNGQSEVEYI
ncbi:hypothetical protein JOF48_000834 [Arthrobacter stackebrandtii]|uniref:NACHT domain-containing protein n=1 Tax=Arthrobacter stackebrandtii TaxID=272161 RepID=A0ABS4YTW4_9MICC|nr:NACHT domain-containing protein [Arthrobacter stackebrandtii]MBP2412035.1 hypothetical protein [Arthrobacter stackebrandtii]